MGSLTSRGLRSPRGSLSTPAFLPDFDVETAPGTIWLMGIIIKLSTGIPHFLGDDRYHNSHCPSPVNGVEPGDV